MKGFEHPGEFFHAIRFNPSDKRLQVVELEGRQQSMGVGVEGGYAIPTSVLPYIMSTSETAVIRPRCTVLPAGQSPDSALAIPTLDEDATQDPTWLAEGDSKPDTNIRLRQVNLIPREMSAAPVCTDKLLRNIPGGGEALAGILRARVSTVEDRAFLVGTGIGQPLGIVNSPCTIAIARATAATISYADVVGMLEALLPGGEPVWVASPSTLPALGAMVDAGNSATWRSYRELLGLPLLFSRQLPALGTAGDLLLADLRRYVVKDGAGPMVQISMDHPDHFLKNEAVVRIVWNTDGQPWLSGTVGGLSSFVMLG